MSSPPPYANGAVKAAMPDGRVIDTDIISYLFRRDTRAEIYRPYLAGADVAVSFMTVAELNRWALQRGWGWLASDGWRISSISSPLFSPVAIFGVSGPR